MSAFVFLVIRVMVRTGIAQIRLVACSLMTLVFDGVVDVLVGFGEASCCDALVGDII
jgi:hypothetical protein